MKLLKSLPPLGLATSAVAAGIYDISVHDADGTSVPFETFDIPRSQTHHTSRSLARRDSEPGYNWCGAVQKTLPSGTFSSVKGTWTVPVVTVPADGTSPDAPYYLYQWVGIDGYYWNSTCDALIQGGTGFILDEGALYSLFVWTEYYPANPVGVSINVTEGDVFTVEVTTTSTETGVITIENLTAGQTTTVNINGTGLGTLCGLTAEWIQENPYYPTEPYPVFTPTVFTNASATTTTGDDVTVEGSVAEYGAHTDGTVSCNATLVSPSEVQILYYPE